MRELQQLYAVVLAVLLHNPPNTAVVLLMLMLLQGHCRVVDLPELQQLLALLEAYGPQVLEPEGVDELLVQVGLLGFICCAYSV